MSIWTLDYDHVDLGGEGLREALCTLGNGYLATRGAAPEAVADGVHYPGTYLAGCFNRLQSEVADHTLEHESNPNLPNWVALTFRIEDGDWFDVAAVDVIDYRQTLDVQRGVLTRSVHFREGGRESLLTQRWFVHMEDPHLAALQTTLLPIGWSGRVLVRSALDGRVQNAGVERYRDLAGQHLEPLAAHAVDPEMLLMRVRTNQSRVEVVEAARTRFFVDGRRSPDPETIEERDYVAHDVAMEVIEGTPLTVEKVVAIYSSRDPAVTEAGAAALDAASQAPTFEQLLERHVLAWRHLWERFQIHIEGGEAEAQALNVHAFHLLSTVSPHVIDLDAGVPARGLAGEAYRGHIFWDELFVFPFLNYRMPAITRALLLYRYRRLPLARRRAREAGASGALYPWQSGSTGREENQTLHLNPLSGRWHPDRSHLQRHINIAVAFNVIEYYEVTGDMEFMRLYGLEMLIEIARFWSSISTYNRALDRYEVCGVMGPDEYHESYPEADRPGLDNNAYTNLMVVWVLMRTLTAVGEVAEREREFLRERLDVSDEELARWEDISRRMRVVFHDTPDGVVISQFERYDELRELDWQGYRRRYGDIQRMDRILEAEGDSANHYKVSKQADVLMLFYLISAEELQGLFERLGYVWDHELIPRNVRYYVPRTSNGSTLSRVVHAWVLARSRRPQSWDFFREALDSDLADIQGGTTREGVHLGAMAGTVDIVQRCWTGLEARDGVLRFNPVLPEGLGQIEFEMRYRQHDLSVTVTHERITIRASRGSAPPIRVALGSETSELEAGAMLEFSIARGSVGSSVGEQDRSEA